MSSNTPIQWCDDSVNPVGGCGGCELWRPGAAPEERWCYAGTQTQIRKGHNRTLALDFDVPELFPGRVERAADCPDLRGKPHRGRYPKPWLDGARRLIFVSDMGDALSEGQYRDDGGYLTAKDKRTAARGALHEGGIPFDYLKSEIVDNVLSARGQRHTWLWLTKRPGRMAEFSIWLRSTYAIAWPGNLWAGTSVTHRGTIGRAYELQKVGAAVTFLSVEPLWEEVSLAPVYAACPSVRWMLLGGESDQGEAKAHTFDLAWARALRDECRAHDVAYFLKQLGSNVVDGGSTFQPGTGHRGEWSLWPTDLRIRDLPPEAYGGTLVEA